MNDKSEHLKVGYVAVVGRPNVGKSTLINALLKQKIAAVSPRPQTTRKKQLGILTLDNSQIIFIDTPGIHQPHHRLGEYMNQAAIETLSDADIIMWMVDSSSPPLKDDQICADHILALGSPPPVILVMNKIDLLTPDQINERQEQFLGLYSKATILRVSAKLGIGLFELLDEIQCSLPIGDLYFQGDQITDYHERDIAVELIREAALIQLRDEVPHCLAVRLDEYKDRDQDNSYIKATLFVEKESQKGIVIGKGGEMLKKIGSDARREIEEMTARKIYLELRVKVSKNWRNTPQALKMMGYSRDNG